MAKKWVSLDKLRYAISKIHTLLQGKLTRSMEKVCPPTI